MLVRICDECESIEKKNQVAFLTIPIDRRLTSANTTPHGTTGNYGSYEGRCVICGGAGVSDAYYCRECCQEERVSRTWGGPLMF